MIEILVLQARARQALGADAAARAALARALTLAEPEGYVRIFVDEGAALAALLGRAAAGGATQAYARRLLAAMGQAAEEAAPAPAAPAARPLPEPLTERELEVLQHLAAGRSNQEIAARLVLALPTVKRHVGHILAKLEATSRGHAVARARELDLIP